MLYFFYCMMIVAASHVDDPRCGQLDSTYVLPHDTTIIGLIVRIDGHWERYNWVNGKRVNMRSVK